MLSLVNSSNQHQSAQISILNQSHRGEDKCSFFSLDSIAKIFSASKKQFLEKNQGHCKTVFFVLEDIVHDNLVFDPIYKKPVLQNQPLITFLPKNGAVKLIGGYVIHVLTKCLPYFLDLLKIQLPLENLKLEHKFSDIDLRIEYPQITNEAIYHYLDLCHKAEYTPKKNDISLPNTPIVINAFKSIYQSIFQKQYPYEIYLNEESQAFYLHLTIDQFDISYTFTKAKHLFSIDSVALNLGKNVTFQISEVELIELLADILTKNLKIASPEFASAKVWWKALHYQTKGGFRTLDTDNYTIIREKALKRVTGDQWPAAIRMLNELMEKHGDNDPSYAAVLISYLYYEKVIPFDKLAIIKASLGNKEGTDCVFKSLFSWDLDLNKYFSLLAFSAFSALCLPAEKNPVCLVQHLNQDYLRVEDNYFLLIPFDLKKICYDFTLTLEDDCSEVIWSLLNRLAPLTIAEISESINLYVENLLPIAIDLLQKENWSHIGGYLCLLLYTTQKIKIDSRFFESIPFIFKNLSIDKKRPLAQALQKVFYHEFSCDSNHWFHFFLQNITTIPEGVFNFGYFKALIELGNHTSLLKALNTYLETTLFDWLMYLALNDCSNSEKEFISYYSILSLEQILEIFSLISSPSKKLKKIVFSQLLENHYIPKNQGFEDIAYQAINYEAIQDFDKSYSYFEVLANNCKSNHNHHYYEALETLQSHFFVLANEYLKIESYKEAVDFFDSHLLLWQEILDFPSYAYFINSLVDRYFFTNKDKIESYRSLVKSLASSISKIDFTVHGSLFSLAVLTKTIDEPLLMSAIRSFKKSKEKPLLEYLFIVEILENIKRENRVISSECQSVISSFLIYAMKHYKKNTLIPLLSFFLKKEKLVASLSYIDDSKQIKDFLIKIKEEDPDYFYPELKAILRKFFESILNLNELEDVINLSLFEYFLPKYFDLDLTHKILEKLSETKNYQTAHRVLEILETKLYQENFEKISFQFLELLVSEKQFDLVFTHLKKQSNQSFLPIFTKAYSLMEKENFYKILYKYELLSLYLKQVQDFTFEDIIPLLPKKSPIVKTILMEKFSELIQDNSIQTFVPILQFFLENPKSSTFFKEPCEKFFDKISTTLIQKKLYEPWVMLLKIVDLSILKGKAIIQSFFLETLKNFIDTKNDQKITELLTQLINLQEQKKGFLHWDKKTFWDLYDLSLCHIFTYKKFVEMCHTLRKSISKQKTPLDLSPFENLLNEGQADIAFVRYFFYSFHFKTSPNSLLILTRILKALNCDSLKCKQVIQIFLINKEFILKNVFPSFGIDSETLLDFFKNIVTEYPELVLTFIDQTKIIDLNLYHSLLNIIENREDLLLTYFKPALDKTSIEKIDILLEVLECIQKLKCNFQTFFELTKNFYDFLASLKDLKLLEEERIQKKIIFFLEKILIIYQADIFTNYEDVFDLFKLSQNLLTDDHNKCLAQFVFAKKMMYALGSPKVFSDIGTYTKGISNANTSTVFRNLLHLEILYAIQLSQLKKNFDKKVYYSLLECYKTFQHTEFHKIFNYIPIDLDESFIKIFLDIIEKNIQSLKILEESRKVSFENQLYLFFYYYASEVIQYYEPEILCNKIAYITSFITKKNREEIVNLFENHIIWNNGTEQAQRLSVLFRKATETYENFRRGIVFLSTDNFYLANDFSKTDLLFSVYGVEFLNSAFNFSEKIKEKICLELNTQVIPFMEKLNTLDLAKETIFEEIKRGQKITCLPEASDDVNDFFKNSYDGCSNLTAFLEAYLRCFNLSENHSPQSVFLVFYFTKILVKNFSDERQCLHFVVTLSTSLAVLSYNPKQSFLAQAFLTTISQLIRSKKKTTSYHYLMGVLDLLDKQFDLFKKRGDYQSLDLIYNNIKNQVQTSISIDCRPICFISTITNLFCDKVKYEEDVVKFYFSKGFHLMSTPTTERFFKGDVNFGKDYYDDAINLIKRYKNNYSITFFAITYFNALKKFYNQLQTKETKEIIIRHLSRVVNYTIELYLHKQLTGSIKNIILEFLTFFYHFIDQYQSSDQLLEDAKKVLINIGKVDPLIGKQMDKYLKAKANKKK